MEKEYGKLSQDQLKRLIDQVPRALDHFPEIQSKFRGDISPTAGAALEEGLYWAHLYELPLSTHIAFAVEALGQSDRVLEIASAADPQEEAIQDLERDDNADETFENPLGLTDADRLSIALSIQYTMKSVASYGRSLSALVAELKTGSDKSLFDAIRIDRTVITGPTAALRIAKAELQGDRHFFDSLRRSQKGMSRKLWRGREQLRYMWFALRNSGSQGVPVDTLVDLVVKELGIYPDNPGAKKNLLEQYYRSQKFKDL